MRKRARQENIMEIVRSKKLTNQKQIQNELEPKGIQSTQASISRDLIELGIVKVKGIYRLPHMKARKAGLGEILDIDTAGKNLIVIKTPPGQASMTALAIDQAKIPGAVGTVAGDDTFFIAVKSNTEQKIVIRQILRLMR